MLAWMGGARSKLRAKGKDKGRVLAGTALSLLCRGLVDLARGCMQLIYTRRIKSTLNSHSYIHPTIHSQLCDMQEMCAKGLHPAEGQYTGL